MVGSINLNEDGLNFFTKFLLSTSIYVLLFL